MSRFNAERNAGLDRPAFKEFWFESSKGRKIHNWLALPAGFDESKKYPLVLQIHGGPFSSSMDASHVRWSSGLIGHAGLVDLKGQYSSSDTVYNREIMNGSPAWGDSDVWSEQSPSTYADKFSTPILLTIGEKDFRVPINQTIAAWTYIQRNQVPGRLLVFHDANHWVMKGAEARYYWEEVHAWLNKYLGSN